MKNLDWEDLLCKIRSSVSESDYSAFFSRIGFAGMENNTVKLIVPNRYFMEKFKKSVFPSLIKKTLFNETGTNFEITLELNGENPVIHKPEPLPEKEIKEEKKAKNEMFNPAYTFDSFIPGDNSIFPYNACMAIAKDPGNSIYNPCLIYGGVGLGKTHLIQSIGNYLISQNPDFKVVYVTAENFLNEFSASIREKNPQAFKNKYRKVQVLLIDDIHLLQGRGGTQDELFNTFNDLYETGRQIVFTCDRPIEELKDISERLKSRFSRGLNLDLKAPNYETRLAILNKKCEEMNFNIQPEILDFIASNISSNVRTLESCIKKLYAYSTLLKKEITLETAKEQLNPIINSSKDVSGLTLDSLIKSVASFFNITPMDIKGKSRNKGIIIPRQLSMYLCRQLTEFSTNEIGDAFGGKNHTTVMSNVSKIQSELDNDNKEIRDLIEKLTNKIKQDIK